MSYIPALYGQIDSNNSSNTPLGIGEVFTGVSTPVFNFASIMVAITSDQSGSLQLQFSSDGTNWDLVEPAVLTVPSPGTNTSMTLSPSIKAKYFRIVYTNGANSQSVFRLQTILNGQSASVISLSAKVKGSSEQKQLECDPSGSLQSKLIGPMSTFGDARTIGLTPIAQFNFVHGINSNYVSTDTATGGTVSSTGSLALMTVTQATGSSSSIQSHAILPFHKGVGGFGRYTSIFLPGIENNIQISGCGDSSEGYFFGFNGTSFGILYQRNNIETWIPQDSWNVDKFLSLDPTKGNIYQIVIPNLDFGNINFYIYNAEVNEFILVHVIRYANAHTQPILTNPRFRLFWKTYNTGATASDIVLKAGSGSLYTDGEHFDNIGAKYGTVSTRVNPGEDEINIVTIRNNTTINGITNKISVSIYDISYFLLDKDKDTIFAIAYVRKNASVSGNPTFVDIDSVNSAVSVDKQGTYITGGSIIRVYTNPENNIVLKDIFLLPGETLTMSIQLSNSKSGTIIGGSINWVEN